jgi:hypothetical protein
MRVGEANNLEESDAVEFKDELGRKEPSIECARQDW